MPQPASAAGASVLEQHRGHPLDLPQHLVRQRANLPLRAIAAAQGEEVPQLPGVHGHDQPRRARLQQTITRVLGEDTSLQTVGIEERSLFRKRLEARIEVGISGDANRHDHLAPAALDIALALHAEAGDSVPGELRQRHAADALHEKAEAGVLRHALMPASQRPAKRGFADAVVVDVLPGA